MVPDGQLTNVAVEMGPNAPQSIMAQPTRCVHERVPSHGCRTWNYAKCACACQLGPVEGGLRGVCARFRRLRRQCHHEIYLVAAALGTSRLKDCRPHSAAVDL